MHLKVIIRSDNLFFNVLSSSIDRLEEQRRNNNNNKNKDGNIPILFDTLGEVIFDACDEIFEKADSPSDQDFKKQFNNGNNEFHNPINRRTHAVAQNHIDFPINNVYNQRDYLENNDDHNYEDNDYSIDVVGREILNVPKHTLEGHASVSFSFKTHQPNQLLMLALLKTNFHAVTRENGDSGFTVNDASTENSSKFLDLNNFKSVQDLFKEGDPGIDRPLQDDNHDNATDDQFMALELVDGWLKRF